MGLVYPSGFAKAMKACFHCRWAISPCGRLGAQSPSASGPLAMLPSRRATAARPAPRAAVSPRSHRVRRHRPAPRGCLAVSRATGRAQAVLPCGNACRRIPCSIRHHRRRSESAVSPSRCVSCRAANAVSCRAAAACFDGSLAASPRGRFASWLSHRAVTRLSGGCLAVNHLVIQPVFPRVRLAQLGSLRVRASNTHTRGKRR
jgi:hypothetical protein